MGAAQALPAPRARHAAAQQHPLPGDRADGRAAARRADGAAARAWTARAHATGLLFNIALNYGGRAEITDAVRRLATDLLANGRDPCAHRRGAALVVPLHGRPARSRPAHPHQRRAARLELPALADRLRRDLGDRGALAGLPAPRTCCRRSPTTRSASAATAASPRPRPREPSRASGDAAALRARPARRHRARSRCRCSLAGCSWAPARRGLRDRDDRGRARVPGSSTGCSRARGLRPLRAGGCAGAGRGLPVRCRSAWLAAGRRSVTASAPVAAGRSLRWSPRRCAPRRDFARDVPAAALTLLGAVYLGGLGGSIAALRILRPLADGPLAHRAAAGDRDGGRHRRLLRRPRARPAQAGARHLARQDGGGRARRRWRAASLGALRRAASPASALPVGARGGARRCWSRSRPSRATSSRAC